MRSLAKMALLATVALMLSHEPVRAQGDALSRYRAWYAGSQLSSTVLMYDSGRISRDQVLERNSKTAADFSVDIPSPPPLRTGNSRDRARLMDYVTDSLEPAAAARFRGQDRLLFTIAFRSNIVLLAYSPDIDLSGLANLIRKYASALYISESAWEPYVAVLESHGRYDDLVDATVRMNAAVSEILHSAAMPPAGAETETPTDRNERQSLASHYAAAKTNKLWIDPVVSALKRGAANDSELQRLLAQVRITAAPYFTRPANSYATPAQESTPGKVEIDCAWSEQVMSSAALEGLALVDPSGRRGLVRRATALLAQAVRQAIRSGTSQPNFSIEVTDYVNEPYERSVVETLAYTLSIQAMAWTVLHEIAHHRLGHLGPQAENAELSVKREWEYGADDWACRKMIDLGLPLHGVAVLMNLMSTVFQAQSESGLLPPEEAFTHPSWPHRRERLERTFDLLASTNRPWINFRSVALSSGNAQDVKHIFFAFPPEPQEFGLCKAIALVPGYTKESFAIERVGQSVYLRQPPTEGEVVDIQIVNPRRASTLIVATVKNAATGEQKRFVRPAWEDPPLLNVDAPQIESPKVLFAKVLGESGAAGQVRRQALAALDLKLASDCQIMIAAGKGLLTREEMERRSDEVLDRYQSELAQILGRQTFDRLNQRLNALMQETEKNP